jgi:hypothetical protein
MSTLDDVRMIAFEIYTTRLALAEQSAERNNLIVEAHSEGHSLRSIAEAADVSHQTIANILAAHNE